MTTEFHSLDTSALNPDLPLMLLDVDGVLNAFQYRPAETDQPADAYTDLHEYDVPTDFGRTYRFWTSPTLIAEIAALHATGTVDIAWLTTWENQANTHAARVLGLPTFPVAATRGGRFSDYYWKARAGLEAMQLGRPVIWIDDTEVTPTEIDAYRESDVPHLLIAPDPAVGLTRTHMDDVRQFIATHG